MNLESKFVRLLLVFASALFVIFADSLIKSSSHEPFLGKCLVLPKMWLCYILYFVQIIFAIWILRHGMLSIYTNLFVVFYSIFGVISGYLLFAERITPIQWVGVVLGIIAAYLMQYPTQLE